MPAQIITPLISFAISVVLGSSVIASTSTMIEAAQTLQDSVSYPLTQHHKEKAAGIYVDQDLQDTEHKHSDDSNLLTQAKIESLDLKHRQR